MKTPKHSPTPWKSKRFAKYRMEIIDANGDCVSSSIYGGADLRHIVHCVNTLAEMVEALEAVQSCCRGPVTGMIPRLSDAIKLIDAALEAAKGAE